MAFFVFWTVRLKKVHFSLDFRQRVGKMDRQFTLDVGSSSASAEQKPP